MKLRSLKCAAGFLAAVLGATHTMAVTPEINTARNAMRNADYQSMVSTLNPYVASHPADQEARLLRAIGTAGVVAKSNFPAFLMQKGATRVKIDPFDKSSADFPVRPTMSVGYPWEQSGGGYSIPAGNADNTGRSYLLAWHNTGASSRSFKVNVTPLGQSIHLSLYWNGDYTAYLNANGLWDFGEHPTSPFSNITTNPFGEIRSFTVTLGAGEWLAVEGHVYYYNYTSDPAGGFGNAAVSLATSATLPADIEFSTGRVPLGSAIAFSPGTNAADAIAFLGTQQDGIDSILADLAVIQSGFSTTFSTYETGVAGTVVVEHADVQMLVGLLKSSQGMHRLLKTFNTEADLTNSNIIEEYQSTVTGDWKADDFMVAHGNLLRPTADDPAARAAARTLIGDAAGILLAVENTLFTRPAPAAGSSYVFAIDPGDPATAQKRADYHGNLVKIRDSLDGYVALDFPRTDLPATAQGSLAPLFATAPLDLRSLFEISSRGILVGGAKKILASGLVTNLGEYQLEKTLRRSGNWALGGDHLSYYDGLSNYFPAGACFRTTIERGAPADIPYYHEGVFASDVQGLQYQWQLRKPDPDGDWWSLNPVFEPFVSSANQWFNMALLNDPTHRGAYLTVRYPNPNGGELTGTQYIWVDWAGGGVGADFDPMFTITHSPMSRFFKEGQTINLWVGTDTISKDMEYQWYKNNQPITSATNALHTIANATAADAGDYHVTVKNRAITTPVPSETARVALWSDSLVPPALSVSPTTTQAIGTGSGTLLFAVENAGGGSMPWTAKILPGGDWVRVATGTSGFNSGTITVSYDANPLGGAMRDASLQVAATGAANSPATVTLRQAANQTSPSNLSPLVTQQIVAAGKSLSFAASADGAPAPAYRWQVSTNNGATWADIADNAFYSGAGTGMLSITGASASMDGYRYRYIATNPVGSGTSSAAALKVAAAVYSSPVAIAIDSTGNLYVSDAAAHTIHKVGAQFSSTLFAGTPNQSALVNATGTAARFSKPAALALTAAGDLLVADSGNAVIRKITPGAVVATLATGFSQPSGIALDPAGKAYVADTAAHTLSTVATDGTVTFCAGAANQSGAVAAAGAAARFNAPTRVHIDNAGALYIADTGNDIIRTESASHTMLIYAGRANVSGTADGNAADARLNKPQGMTSDRVGNVYFADTNNNTIRVLSNDGEVLTLAGVPGVAGLRDGAGANALFDHPSDVALDGAGNLYVVDTGNTLIRKITLTGTQFSSAQVTSLLITSATASGTTSGTGGNNGGNTGGNGGGGGGGAPALPWFALLGVFFLIRVWKQRR